MTLVFVLTLCVLMLALAGGFVRVLLGPTPADRMTAAQLLGTIGVAAVLLLGEVVALPAARDVALVLAVLAAVATLAFARLWSR